MMRVFLGIISLMIIVLLISIPGSAKINPEEVQNGHVWLFEDIENGKVQDSAVTKLNATIKGNPKQVKGLNGMALEFNGISDAVTVPDSKDINTTGPFTNRTVKVLFNCADVSKNQKQTLFEEGGRTRGLVIYIFSDGVYAGAWNRSEYNWRGAWISAPIRSDIWYEVAAILRDTKGAVEPDKFEMWLDGRLIKKEPGGQLNAHGDNNGIGMTNQNTVFHDEDGSGTNRDYFEGLIDEVWVLNVAVTADDLRRPGLSVEAMGKLTAAWGAIKMKH